MSIYHKLTFEWLWYIWWDATTYASREHCYSIRKTQDDSEEHLQCEVASVFTSEIDVENGFFANGLFDKVVFAEEIVCFLSISHNKPFFLFHSLRDDDESIFSCLACLSLITISSVFVSISMGRMISLQAHGGVVAFQGRSHTDYVNY